MTDEKDKRGGGWVPLSRLRMPKGGPPAVYQAVRLARAREALGPRLGPHLVDLVQEPGTVRLVFAGKGWERSLEPLIPALTQVVEGFLGRSGFSLSILSDPGRPGPSQAAEPIRGLPVGNGFSARLEEVIEKCRKVGSGIGGRAR